MKRLRLLLVEDSEDDAALVVRELTQSGYEIEHRRVQSDEDFLHALEEGWDVVLADYSMPGFSGTRALQLLRQRERLEPFVFVSGTIGEERAVEAMREGAQDYVLKHDLHRLVPVVERAIRDAEVRRRGRELREQLIQAQRLEAVGQLASGIAHDFGNLLTVIIGVSEMLQEDEALSPATHAQIGEIREAAERAAVLTRRLLSFSRKQVVELTVFDLNEVVTSVERMLRRLIGEDVTLETRLDPQLPPVYADRSQMEQVLLNLVVNSRDALPAGGTISIETRAQAPHADRDPETAGEWPATRPQRRQPEVGREPQTPVLDPWAARARSPSPSSAPGRWVELTVRDDGTGMLEEVKARVFEPLFTTKERGRGTGLGLATCKAIVEDAGGEIGVETAPDLGTTVRVILPSTSNPRAENGDTASRDLRGGEHVVLVEDDAAVRAVLAEGLTALGYRIVQVADCKAAARILRDPARRIDALITDLVLTDGSGATLAQTAHHRVPRPEIVLISGYADDRKLVERLGGIAAAVVQKPVTPLSMAARLRDVFDGGGR
jgi:signal transduction histidine kinase